MVEVRLQKVLAAAGLGSRRKCEELISAGRVTVNDVIISELGSRVDPDSCVIRVDGVRIAQAQGHVVYALNKPRGVVTTMSDPQQRPCVGDLVTTVGVRLFHVGRLDADTEGLLLLTNDGELADRLAHPSHGVPKTYVAKVAGRLDKAIVRHLLAGVPVDERTVEVTKCSIIDTASSSTVVELEIHEGRNRIIRRLLEQVGHPVLELVRTQVGPISLGRLRTGSIRQLTNQELGKLYQAADL